MLTVSDNKTIKQRARQLVRESRPRPVLVTLLLLLILLVFAFFRAKLSGVFDSVLLEPLKEYYQAAAAGDVDHAMAVYQEWMEIASEVRQPFIHQVITFAISIVSYVLTAGYLIFILNSVRKKDPTVYNLLDGFGQFLRVTILSFILSILVSVMAFIMAMAVLLPLAVLEMILLSFPQQMIPFLLVILFFPAFVFALLIILVMLLTFPYRFALFNLLDHPDMRIFDCLALSRIMLKGNRKRLFKLNLSFAGFILLSLIFPPLLVWLAPYMLFSWVIFYDELKTVEFPQGDLLDRIGEDRPEDE